MKNKMVSCSTSILMRGGPDEGRRTQGASVPIEAKV